MSETIPVREVFLSKTAIPVFVTSQSEKQVIMWLKRGGRYILDRFDFTHPPFTVYADLSLSPLF